MGGAFVDRFSTRADAYRQGRPTYPADLLSALAEVAPGRELAWDCGTGNGQAALGLAGEFARVFATDASERQIAQATPHERVTYRVEPAESVSLPDASVDLVLAAQCLHWFDLHRFYAQAQRVLKPGGVLAAVGYDWLYVTPAVDRAINRRLIQPLAPYWAPHNKLLWDGYRSIPFPGEEVRLGAHAIYLDWSFEELSAYVTSWSAVGDLIREEGEQALAAALDEISAQWGGGRRQVVIPLHLRVAKLGS